jgi:hypothetical protein
MPTIPEMLRGTGRNEFDCGRKKVLSKKNREKVYYKESGRTRAGFRLGKKTSKQK